MCPLLLHLSHCSHEPQRREGLPREGRLAAESSPLTSAAAKNITHTTPRVASGTAGGMPPLVATKRNCLAMCRRIVTLCQLFPGILGGFELIWAASTLQRMIAA